MPRFDYQCVVCNEIYKDIQIGIDEEPRFECCQMPMEKLYSAPAVVFKGKGFYSTDK